MNLRSIASLSNFPVRQADAVVVLRSWIDARTITDLQSFVAHSPASVLVVVANQPQFADETSVPSAAGIAAIELGTQAGHVRLREALACNNYPDGVVRGAVALCISNAVEDPADIVPVSTFFRLLFTPRIRSAKELAFALGELPSTMTTRFFRAGLPSPREYVANARLVWAAYLGESRMSIAAIARRLHAASPQGFHRTVRTITRLSVAGFRQAFSGERMLETFVSDFVLPHREALRAQLVRRD